MHLGTCGAQDNSGELLGHVMDTGADPTVERQYKTRAAIDYHCDAAEVVGLLCLGASTEGGESTLVSSAMAYNRLLAEEPHLIDRLYEPFLLDTRGSGGIQAVKMESARHGADGRLRVVRLEVRNRRSEVGRAAGAEVEPPVGEAHRPPSA